MKELIIKSIWIEFVGNWVSSTFLPMNNDSRRETQLPERWITFVSTLKLSHMDTLEKRNKETQLAPTTVKAQCGLPSMHWLSNRYYKWSKWLNEEWWEFCFCLLTWWQKSKRSRWRGKAPLRNHMGVGMGEYASAWP